VNVRSADAPSVAEVRAVEELLRMLGKGQRALQMYLPNNPVYQRTLQQVTDAFKPVWDVTGRLVLDIQEEQITWDGVPVLAHPTRNEGLPWQLYKDGLRQLSLAPGVEVEEIFRLLRVVNRAKMLPADAADDLLTLIWEQEFVHIAYAFVEVSGDGAEFEMERGSGWRGSDEGAPGRASQPEAAEGGAPGRARQPGSGAARADVAEGIAGGRGSGVVDLGDFDATPYFLEESEIRFIQSELEAEYRRDIRESAIDALLDILEMQQDAAVRREAIGLLEEILPAQLATGGFAAVARILRELRVIATRANALDDSLQGAVLSFEQRLSSTEILEQLFRVLADHAVHPATEDVGEVLRELRPAALPVVLAHMGRVVDPAVRRTLESSVDAIARTQPDALTALLKSGPEDALVPAIALAARLGIVQVVPAIIEHLHTGDEPLRLAAVRALGELNTPTAIAAIESALDDPERGVRQSALALLLARGGSGGLAGRLESLLFDGAGQAWERSEQRAMFEAYGAAAGNAAVPRLTALLEPRGVFRRRAAADVLASALFALGRVRTSEARVVVQRFVADKEPVVRSAANSTLREWAV
jgi:HEAT repeat protein